MATVKLGSQDVAPMGYGVMGLAWAYAATSYDGAANAEAVKATAKACFAEVMKQANGAPVLSSTANIYATPGLPHADELIGDAIKEHGRDKVVVAAKLGVDFALAPRISDAQKPELLTKQLDETLARLGVDCLDVLVLNRPSPSIPIEDTMNVIKGFVEAGKVKQVGISEATAEEIRKAHAVVPIAFVEQEFSLHTRNIVDLLFPTLKELNIGLLAYAPLSRGLLAGLSKENLKQGDWRLTQPRFNGENGDANASAAGKIAAFAAKKGCTAAQVAIAYTVAKAAEYGIACVPIPGSTKPERIAENAGAAAVKLTKEEVAELESIVPPAQGERYQGMHGTFEAKLPTASSH